MSPLFERTASHSSSDHAALDQTDIVGLLRSAVTPLKRLSTAQRVGLVAAAIFYTLAGTQHFIKPAFYLRIMPPYIPWHLAMVCVSGIL